MASLRELQPWLAPYAEWFFNYLEGRGEHPRVTSVHRSRQVQAVLFERWKRGATKFPVAPPGASWHEYRRAFDMVVDHPLQAGTLWKRMGGSWWPGDEIHFQA